MNPEHSEVMGNMCQFIVLYNVMMKSLKNRQSCDWLSRVWPPVAGASCTVLDSPFARLSLQSMMSFVLSCFVSRTLKLMKLRLSIWLCILWHPRSNCLWLMNILRQLWRVRIIQVIPMHRQLPIRRMMTTPTKKTNLKTNLGFQG